MTTDQARRTVRNVAAAGGLTIEVQRFSRTAEILVTAKQGFGWPYDCHQRVFETDSVANCWIEVAEEIDYLAAHQTLCTADSGCVGWDDDDANCCGFWRGDYADLINGIRAMKNINEGHEV
jgi:hypothetical protein